MDSGLNAWLGVVPIPATLLHSCNSPDELAKQFERRCSNDNSITYLPRACAYIRFFRFHITKVTRLNGGVDEAAAIFVEKLKPEKPPELQKVVEQLGEV